MDKQFLQLIGNVGKDVTLERVMSFLKQDAEAMVGRNETESTKKVIVEISIKEVKDVV
jgi:hypothetical protein